MLNNIKEILQLLKDKTVRLALLGLILTVFSFVGGRISVNIPKCDINSVCGDIIRDRDELSSQLTECMKNARKKREKALEDLRLELNVDCAQRISEAAECGDFDPDIHCPICIARGECKENDY